MATAAQPIAGVRTAARLLSRGARALTWSACSRLTGARPGVAAPTRPEARSSRRLHPEAAYGRAMTGRDVHDLLGDRGRDGDGDHDEEHGEDVSLPYAHGGSVLGASEI